MDVGVYLVSGTKLGECWERYRPSCLNGNGCWPSRPIGEEFRSSVIWWLHVWGTDSRCNITASMLSLSPLKPPSPRLPEEVVSLRQEQWRLAVLQEHQQRDWYTVHSSAAELGEWGVADTALRAFAQDWGLTTWWRESIFPTLTVKMERRELPSFVPKVFSWELSALV